MRRAVASFSARPKRRGYRLSRPVLPAILILAWSDAANRSRPPLGAPASRRHAREARKNVDAGETSALPGRRVHRHNQNRCRSPSWNGYSRYRVQRKGGDRGRPSGAAYKERNARIAVVRSGVECVFALCNRYAPSSNSTASFSRRAATPCSARALRTRLRVRVKYSPSLSGTRPATCAAVAAASASRRCSASPAS